MTVAKAMKSPGQKLKSPKGKDPATPNLKSPKGKGPATPKGTPSLAKTPKGTPHVAKTPKGTPNVAKTPKGTPNAAKTPKGTPNVVKTPKGAPTVAMTPKGMPNVTKTPKGTPNVAKTPKGTPNVAKTPKETLNVAKTPKETPNVAKTPKETPNVAKTPKETPNAVKTPKGTPSVAKTLQSASEAAKGSAKVAQSPVGGKKRPFNGSPNAVKTSFFSEGVTKSLKPKLPSEASNKGIAFRKVRISNVSDDATPKLREILTPRGEIVQIKRRHHNFVVEFKTAEEARAAKKLNGLLLDGRHLTISHVDDSKIPIHHRLTLSNPPQDLNDEDVWSTFGKYGKIARIAISRDRKKKNVTKCVFSFEEEASVKAALSSGSVNIRGSKVKVSVYTPEIFFPFMNTVFISNITSDVTEEDVLKFVSKAGPVSGVRINAPYRDRHAMVYMTNVADVEKVLQLNNTTFKNSIVKVMRHKRAGTATVKEEVPSKKQKLNNGVAKAQEAKATVKKEEDDDSDDSEDEDLAAFQGQLQKLNAVEGSEDDDDEEDDDEDDDDDDDEEDDDDDEDDVDDEEGEEDGDEDDDDEDEDDEDDDDEGDDDGDDDDDDDE